MSSIPQKRSRFAKTSVKNSISLPEGEIFGEEMNDLDYMAPLESLLPEHALSQPAETTSTTTNPSKQPKLSIKMMMEDNRERGLAAPIDEKNIGFKLLKKIGYTEGGLGKEGKGMLAPVSVTKRSSDDASGLGILEKKERKQVAIATFQTGKRNYVDKLQQNFVHDKSIAKQQLKSNRDLYKAQKVIYELDEAAGVPVHRLTQALHQHYTDLTTSTTTPSYITSEGRDQGNIDNNHRDTALPLSYSHALSDRLFDKDSYGQEAQDQQEEETGDVVDCYSDTVEYAHPPALHSRTEEQHWQQQQEDGPSLPECLQYMREKYCYCYYCGARFTDTVDLEQNCPGLTEEDH